MMDNTSKYDLPADKTVRVELSEHSSDAPPFNRLVTPGTDPRVLSSKAQKLQPDSP